MRTIESRLQAELAEAIHAAFGVALTGPVPIEISNRPDLGDYASPVAFSLAKDLRRAPLEIAEQLAAAVDAASTGTVSAASASAPGFVNVRIAPAVLGDVVAAALETGGRLADTRVGVDQKVVVEHTNVNPNKAAHVGHFRNACIGDTVVRMLRRSGHAVEVQNYIDDTGVQVADIVVGLYFLDLAPTTDLAFDRHCSQVYVQVREAYDRDPGLEKHRQTVQHALESGTGELAAFAKEVTARVAAGNLATMARVGVSYDLLAWESDILAVGLWDRTLAKLQAGGVIRFEESGPNAGCWVLPMGAGALEIKGKTVSEDKVLVTSRGVATYTAKDLAYQLWKFGLLATDFNYRVWGTQADGVTLWTTTAGQTDAGSAPPGFGHADRVINVIDVSQSYPQQVLREALTRLGFGTAADASEHLAYGKVTLSAAAGESLGVTMAEGATTAAMSGRAGIQVLADDLLDRLESLVAAKGDQSDARAIAAGAARYYMLKFGLNQELAFDFEDALRTTGESGVYLQYSYVRAMGILRKVGDLPEGTPPEQLDDLERRLVLAMADYPRMLANATRERSPQTLAKYAFELASAFSAFYDNTPPIVTEERPLWRTWRRSLVEAFRLVLGDVMDVLGIPRLERL